MCYYDGMGIIARKDHACTVMSDIMKLLRMSFQGFSISSGTPCGTVVMDFCLKFAWHLKLSPAHILSRCSPHHAAAANCVSQRSESMLGLER